MGEEYYASSFFIYALRYIIYRILIPAGYYQLGLVCL